MQIIAEVKTKSPFGWESSQTWEQLFEIAKDFGDVISIHTDQRWGGSFELIKQARQLTDKPILAKGIHESDEEIKRAIDYGADFVLVVGRLPNVYLEKCWLEPYTLAELQQLPRNSKAVWNSRDLNTGSTKIETFASARQIHKGWLCQASNISRLEDINPQADAVLIGTNLVELSKLENEIRKF